MPSELSTIGDVSLGLIVKRVKGKLYVYEYVKVDGKPITRYIGPLEEIVRTYQTLKAGITVNHTMRTRQLRRLAQYIVDNLMEKLREDPGVVVDRPGFEPGTSRVQAPSGRGSGRKTAHKVIHSASVCVEITKELVEEFFRWVKEVNPSIGSSTLRQYSYYIPKLTGITLCSKEDVSKAFAAMGGLNKSSYEAFSRLLTFLEKTKELDELVVKLRKAMPKKPRTRADTYVPPDTLLLKVRDRIRDVGPPYTLFYNVLVSTGCRGTEARYLIENARKLRAVKLPYGAVRVHVDLQRGSKNEFVMYLPEEVYSQIKEYRGKLPHQDTVEDVFRESGLAVKYFRKWWRQLCKRLKIDSEDIEAFHGRVSSIGGRHYTDWIPILDEDYKRILPHIKKYIIA